MYLDFHGFREKPFNLTPDPRFLFLSKNHREAFAHLLFGIDHRVGFISLTGEVGSGKTTVLRALLSQLDPDRYRTALIFNPFLSAPELLQTINREFGIPAPSDHSSPLDALNFFLLQENAAGRTVVLVIDEAQDLEPSVLEQIRLISNLETDKEKLIQIALSGQPEFGQILEKREMRQLSQRITVRYHLEPMDFQDTVSYIRHRLLTAGRRSNELFSEEALKRIYRYSRGLPRLINAACDRALLAGYTRDAARIGSQIARIAIRDINRDTMFLSLKRRLILISACVVLAVFSAIVYVHWDGLVNRFGPSKRIEARKDTVANQGRFYDTMAAELGKVPEPESARRAFNALASLWDVSSVPEGETLRQINGWERAARDRNLRLHRFSGSLSALLRIGYPAALELTFPGIPGKRFISMVSIKDGQSLVDPPIAGRNLLSPSVIEKYWSGQGFLLWKDSLNLLAGKSQQPKGSHVKQLQDLLRELGTFRSPSTGIYDVDTLSAVKEFQRSRGIEQDGIVGDQTAMLLYRSVDRFEVPALTGGRK